MPFEQRIPHPLNDSAIRHYAPAVAGIYSQEWIFIGEADDIQAQLLKHLRECELGLPGSPTGFVFETCPGAGQRSRRESLILEYSPLCNGALFRETESAMRKRRHAR